MSPSAEELRDRWNGQEARIAAIVADMRSPEPIDWTRNLVAPQPILFLGVGTHPRLETDAASRDLRGICLRNADLTGTSGLADTDLAFATLENVSLGEAKMNGVSFRSATFLGSSTLHRARARH